MAKKRRSPPPKSRTVSTKLTEVRSPAGKRTKRQATKKVAKAPSRKKSQTTSTELEPMSQPATQLLPANRRDSLLAWFELYMGIEAGGNSDNTVLAKKRDLEAFLAYFLNAAGTDRPDQWTRSVTEGFLKHHERKLHKSPTTVNRMLATLKHAAAWIQSQRPFLAGNPCDRIHELVTDEPAWKGLKDVDVTRVRSAAEQLLQLKHRKNQQPERDFALLTVLLHTGLRVSELLALDLAHYQGKHLVNVKRKGRRVTRQVFLTKEAREALERYLEIRGKAPGALFCSKTGKRLARQNVHDALKAMAGQANSTLSEEDQINLSAHVLRHTMLRKAAEKHGIQYAKELSGHASDRYIWRYVQPSAEEKERALEELF